MATPNPVDHAIAAAEALRSLNHATLAPGRPGWSYPGDAYRVIGALEQATGRLDQAIQQVQALLSSLAGDEHLRSARGDLDADLTEARRALNAARTAAGQLTQHLRHAHTAVSHLGSQD